MAVTAHAQDIVEPIRVSETRDGLEFPSIRFTFRTQDNEIFFGGFGVDGAPIEKLERADWRGIDLALWGWTPLETVAGQTGLSAQVEVFRYDDGSVAGCLAILNDSIRTPLGRVKGDLFIHLPGLGRVLYARRGLVIHDEVGFAVQFGRVQWTPNRKALAWELDHLPDRDEADIPNNLGDLISIEHDWPDTVAVANTHQTGSPRNAVYTPMLSNIKYSPRHKGSANGLYRFVLNQIGIWWDKIENGKVVESRQAWGRPYHLVDYESPDVRSNFYDFRVQYGVDRFDDGPRWPRIGEGRPSTKWYDDSFARRNIPPELRGPPPTTNNHVNGYDHEHFEVGKLRIAYWGLGSEIARRELLTVVNCLMSTMGGGPQPWIGYTSGLFHSDRTWGWVVLGYFQAWEVSGDEVYLEAARRALELVETSVDEDGLVVRPFETLLRNGAPLDWDHDYIVSRESQANHRWPETAVASTWQIAPIAGASFHLAERDPDEAWRKRWEDLGVRTVELYMKGLVPGSGVLENYYLRDFDENVFYPEGPPFPHNGAWWTNGNSSSTGTSVWGFPALVRAWKRTGREDFKRAADDIWSRLKNHHGGGRFTHRPGGPAWHAGGFWGEYLGN